MKYIKFIIFVLFIVLLIYFLKKPAYSLVYSVDVSNFDYNSIESYCLSADNKYLIINVSNFSKSYEELPFNKTGKFDVQKVINSTSSLLLLNINESNLVSEYSFSSSSSNNFSTKKELEDYKTSNYAPTFEKITPLPNNKIGLFKEINDYENGIYFSINNKKFKLLSYDDITNYLPYSYRGEFYCSYYDYNGANKISIHNLYDTVGIYLNASDFKTYSNNTLPKLFFDSNKKYIGIMSDYRAEILKLKTNQIIFDKENGFNFRMGFFNKSNKIWLYYKTIEDSYDEDAFKFLIYDIDKNKEIYNESFDFIDPCLSLNDEYFVVKDRKSTVYVLSTKSFLY